MDKSTGVFIATAVLDPPQPFVSVAITVYWNPPIRVMPDQMWKAPANPDVSIWVPNRSKSL